MVCITFPTSCSFYIQVDSLYLFNYNVIGITFQNFYTLVIWLCFMILDG